MNQTQPASPSSPSQLRPRTKMPSLAERPRTPENTNGAANAVNGHRGLETPAPSGMSLTEYSATPNTPPDEKQQRIRSVVPEDFLLPDGYPDVRR